VIRAFGFVYQSIGVTQGVCIVHWVSVRRTRKKKSRAKTMAEWAVPNHIQKLHDIPKLRSAMFSFETHNMAPKHSSAVDRTPT
jgi:hypothetical protein